MELSVDIEGLKFAYREENLTLAGIDMKVKRGQFISILGPNGSGKSTLAKLMNVLLQPVEGKIVICGCDAKNKELVWQIRQKAGMVFQNPDNQIVATTVEDDIAFGLENAGIPREEMLERIERAMEQVQLTSYRSTEPHRLSGGQKQRLAIAGILALQPELIILDEATSMLDPIGRKSVMSTIRALNREKNITVIHISHFPDEAMEADWVYVMKNGKVVLSGEPQHVLTQVDEMEKLGLDVPFTVKLAAVLKKEGIPLSENGMDEQKLVEEIWKFV